MNVQVKQTQDQGWTSKTPRGKAGTPMSIDTTSNNKSSRQGRE